MWERLWKLPTHLALLPLPPPRWYFRAKLRPPCPGRSHLLPKWLPAPQPDTPRHQKRSVPQTRRITSSPNPRLLPMEPCKGELRTGRTALPCARALPLLPAQSPSLATPAPARWWRSRPFHAHHASPAPSGGSPALGLSVDPAPDSGVRYVTTLILTTI